MTLKNSAMDALEETRNAEAATGLNGCNDVWYHSEKEDYTFFSSLSNIQSNKHQCGESIRVFWW